MSAASLRTAGFLVVVYPTVVFGGASILWHWITRRKLNAPVFGQIERYRTIRNSAYAPANTFCPPMKRAT